MGRNKSPKERHTPTTYATLSFHNRRTLDNLRIDICAAWDINSPAPPFPPLYQPDPNTREWGIPLLSALANLAALSRKHGLKEQVVGFAYRNVEWRNLGLKFTEGDYVLRVEDVEWAANRLIARLQRKRMTQ